MQRESARRCNEACAVVTSEIIAHDPFLLTYSFLLSHSPFSHNTNRPHLPPAPAIAPARVMLKKGKGEERIAKIFDSPLMPEEDATFAITNGGIADPS